MKLKFGILIGLAATLVLGGGAVGSVLTIKNQTFKVSFETNGGTRISSLRVKRGSLLTEPDCTKKGYDISDWYNVNKIWDFENDVVTSNITLEATWDLHVYSITYEYPEDATLYHDDEFIDTYTILHDVSLPDMYRDGYYFKGWNTGTELIKKIESSSYYCDLNLVAEWRQN